MRGVFVNREFSPEVERKRRAMLPILRAARFNDDYKKQIRLEKDKVVIKGKDYDMSNIHDLPEDLNAFKVTSKEDSCVVGYFGELNPLTSSPRNSPWMAITTFRVSSSSKQPKPSTLAIQMYTIRLWDVSIPSIVKTCQKK